MRGCNLCGFYGSSKWSPRFAWHAQSEKIAQTQKYLRRGFAVACAKAQTRVGEADGIRFSIEQNKKR